MIAVRVETLLKPEIERPDGGLGGSDFAYECDLPTYRTILRTVQNLRSLAEILAAVCRRNGHDIIPIFVLGKGVDGAPAQRETDSDSLAVILELGRMAALHDLEEQCLILGINGSRGDDLPSLHVVEGSEGFVGFEIFEKGLELQNVRHTDTSFSKNLLSI